ncbi:MAG: hypothetical protein QM757_32930 [Paludibaculum sp.]
MVDSTPMFRAREGPPQAGSATSFTGNRWAIARESSVDPSSTTTISARSAAPATAFRKQFARCFPPL